MNCPNCGRELADGEICTCQNPVYQQPVPETPAMPPVPPVQEPVQPVYQEPYYDPNQGYYDPNAGQQPPMQPPYYPPQQPMAPVVARTDYPEGYKIKKKYIAVILAFMFNGLGIYNFYLGNKTKGLIQVLLSTVGSLFLGLGPIASLIWAYVEGVMILCEHIDADAEGFKIQTFEESLAKEMKKEDK